MFFSRRGKKKYAREVRRRVSPAGKPCVGYAPAKILWVRDLIFLILLCYLAKFAYRFVQIWTSESIDEDAKYRRTDLSLPQKHTPTTLDLRNFAPENFWVPFLGISSCKAYTNFVSDLCTLNVVLNVLRLLHVIVYAIL